MALHVGDQFRRTFATSQATVLPHYSPGYDGWGLKDQSRLFKLLFDGNDGANQENGSHNPIRLLESGGLLPHKTTLTVYGVTPSCDFDSKEIDQYWSCRVGSTSAARSAKYGFPEKTLKKWRDKRLTLKATTEKTIEATFRFDGTTCTSLGVPLAFDYTVRLENQDGRHKIQSTDSQPVANENGYQSMCGYLDNPERFMAQFDAHRPLVGHFLDESLTWQASLSPAGCLCIASEPGSQVANRISNH